MVNFSGRSVSHLLSVNWFEFDFVFDILFLAYSLHSVSDYRSNNIYIYTYMYIPIHSEYHGNSDQIKYLL